MRSEIVKGLSGQTLWMSAQEGRPSATPSVEVCDSDGTVLSALSSSNVSLESVDTTLSASADAGAISVTIASGTPTVGETYLLENPSGQREWVRVRGLLSGVVTLDEKLAYAHTTASTFKSTRFRYTFQTADVAQLREAVRVTASYSYGGATRYLRLLVDCVLMRIISPLTRERVAREWPDVFAQEFTEQRGEDYAPQRAAAWESVCNGLRQHGRRPALVVSAEDVEQWAIAALALRLAEAGVEIVRGLSKPDELEYLRGALEREKTAALGALSWYDEDESGTLDSGESENRQIALVR